MGGAKGAAGCGQIFRSSESYSSQCNCEAHLWIYMNIRVRELGGVAVGL
jgi:uncharacterized C2H2 Zn-finger protein